MPVARPDSDDCRPAEEMTSGVTANHDVYYCQLLSPTGRAISEIHFLVRPADGWVMIQGDKGFRWVQALQVAIDNFINNPKGGGVVLGEWKPTSTKLAAERPGAGETPLPLD